VNYESIAQYSEIFGGFAFVLVAVWLFRRFVLPAVRVGEEARNADLVNAEQRRDDLGHEVAEARAAVEAAERDALAILARSETDARHTQDAIIAEGRREGVRLLQNASGELERARISARDRLRIEFIEKALGRARELAAQELSAEANARLVARTVDELTVGKGG